MIDKNSMLMQLTCLYTHTVKLVFLVCQGLIVIKIEKQGNEWHVRCSDK